MGRRRTVAARVEGPQGGVHSINLSSSEAWRNFIRWLDKAADEKGWAKTTQAELSYILYPERWDGQGNESNKMGTLRKWVWGGWVLETGLREHALGHLSQFTVGLTMKGVAACRDMGIMHVPTAAGATPTRPTVEQEIDVLDDEAEELPEVRPFQTTAPRSLNTGPPAEVTARRINNMREFRDSLTYALYLLDHPLKCDKVHVDDLGAEELFEIAVKKAKGDK